MQVLRWRIHYLQNQLRLVAYLGGVGPLEITNTKNQREIQSEDLFLEITMFLGKRSTKPRQI